MLGWHLTADFFGCSSKILDDLVFVKKVLIQAAYESKGSVLGFKFHKFEPQGISGVVLISESHLSIHTYPEFGHALIDVFTCGKHCKPVQSLKLLRKELKPQRIKVTRIKRG